MSGSSLWKPDPNISKPKFPLVAAVTHLQHKWIGKFAATPGCSQLLWLSAVHVIKKLSAALFKVWTPGPLHDQTKECVGLVLEARQSERCVLWPLLFSLGWDKPGSVAPLRLVGCLIKTPAPSWAYFYSIFSFFSLPLSVLFFTLSLACPLPHSVPSVLSLTFKGESIFQNVKISRNQLL